MEASLQQENAHYGWAIGHLPESFWPTPCSVKQVLWGLEVKKMTLKKFTPNHLGKGFHPPPQTGNTFYRGWPMLSEQMTRDLFWASCSWGGPNAQLNLLRPDCWLGHLLKSMWNRWRQSGRQVAGTWLLICSRYPPSGPVLTDIIGHDKGHGRSGAEMHLGEPRRPSIIFSFLQSLNLLICARYTIFPSF